MGKKVLTLADPVIDSHPGYAATQSILMQHQSGREWFLQNYFDIFSLYDEPTNALLSRFCPFEQLRFSAVLHGQPENIFCPPIKVYSLPRYAVNENKYSIIELVRYFIDKGACLFLYVERLHLMAHNQKTPHTHEIFVYGYDDDEERFYIADYFRGSRYSRTTCSYDEFLNSYLYSSDGRSEDRGAFYIFWQADKINILHYDDSFRYNFSTEKLKERIPYYLNYKKYDLNYRPIIHDIKKDTYVMRWGNETLKCLGKYIITVMEKSEYVDTRQTAMQVDHVRVLIEMLLFLQEKLTAVDEIFISEAKDIQNRLSKIQNITIKYNIRMKYSSAMAHEVEELISTVLIKEEMLLNRLLEVL